MVQTLVNIGTYIAANWSTMLIGFGAILGSIILFLKMLIAFFILVPGPHPEDWFQWMSDKLQAITDWIATVSKK